VANETQHQALYRRYRPQTPTEVLGQEHVVRALTGAIREGRLHHAFLFAGPRGTGKTSTARILAKMIDCDSGPTAEPCGTCEQCVAVRDGTHLDVVEIDAASHGGVEDARELREKAPTAPVQGREKIYIIDEAQRLSREAFDALLKVFEEPPQGVRFVLATTEPHKMPATIVGRCQRFDFRRLTLEQLAEHLISVADAEGIALGSPAAYAIARHAEGSARDALSLLDQASVLGGRSVDEGTLRVLLGTPRGEVQHEIADAVALGDPLDCFRIVDRLVQDGRDIRNLTAELLTHFRDLLLVRTAPGQEDLVDVPTETYELLRVQSGKFTPPELARVLSLLLAAQNDMRWTTSPRLSLELALIRATMPETDASPDGLISRLERLERLANVEPATPAASPGGDPAETTVVEVVAPEPQPEHAAEPSPGAEVVAAPDAGNVDVMMLRRSWPAVIEHLGEMKQPILRALLESATVATFDGETLQLAFPPAFRNNVRQVQNRLDTLQGALSDLFGIRPAITCVAREDRSAGDAASVVLVEEDDVPDEAEALRRIQEMLGARPIEGE
jgi:DNA polymerase III subunit gamma/tau